MAIDVESRRLFESATGHPLGRITQAGILRESVGIWNRTMRVLGSYALVYIVHGGGRYADARRRHHNVHAGDLILLFPDVAHRYGPMPNGRWDEIYIVFDGPVFDMWREKGVLDETTVVYHLEPIEYWLRRFEEVVAPNLPPLERVCRLQSALAGAFTDYERDPVAAREEEWLAHANTLLDSGIGRELYIDDVSRKLGMSPETFRKKFARLSGMPPWRYRMTRVIEQACRLVHEGLLSNKEIAARLGFNDEFHFSRRFKQITGRSPTQFRALSTRNWKKRASG